MEIKTIDDLLSVQHKKLEVSPGEVGLGMMFSRLLIKRFIEEINILKQNMELK